MKTAIVGGGIMGITLAYYLARAGVAVEVFEASAALGGLAGPLTLPDGVEVDRFYHAILPSDAHLNALCAELGIADQLRFKETRTGFYYNRAIYSMNNIVEFLKFPPLGWIDRLRLGITVLAAQRVRDWQELEGVSVEEWLIRLGGKNTYQNIWRPMLAAKFDGDFRNVPATWIWSRLVRVKSTRQGASQREGAGHIIGGYITLIKAMAQQIEAAGGRIHLATPVQEVCIEGNRATGVRLADGVHTFDAVAVTSQVPIFKRLIPGAAPEYHEFLGKTDYLGIVCPLLVLERPLTGYWTLNITDERIPFTGVIETTAYIDPLLVGGHSLVYLPKYTAPGSTLSDQSDAEIRSMWMENLHAMFPAFDEATVRYFLVHRERYVEPLHGLNSAHLIPAVETPVRSLFLVTTAQIYPALTNGESVSRHGHEAAEAIQRALAMPVAVAA
ncbi:NAD(P)/FAD-dependent oxidoreductase [Caldilinea sp.]|uniref:NAD(P)/FAD-dependent oxidoreductase n=1 Tax=Caldilinea sp. TaxID=2293560 RepID=UPI002C727ADC|nr:NAD(P)/FAD-dependent oxidoreductase [Anaerolineales bacterium]HQY94374.1 NAD(P)/FAD-dependent oxidoreductase [Caldilinea sp.]